MKDSTDLPAQPGNSAYATSHTETETGSMPEGSFASPGQLYGILLLTLFLGEAFVMLLLSVMPSVCANGV